MDRFTSDVARVLRDDELHAGDPAAALADVRRIAARRRRLRMTAVLASAVLAVAASAVGVSLATGGEVEQRPVGPTPEPTSTQTPDTVPTVDAVPWSARTDYRTWEAPSPEPRATTTACTADDLRVRAVDSEGATQSYFRWVTLVKRTAGSCTLTGYPGLSGTDSSGHRTAIPLSHDANSAPGSTFRETPATIEAHETTQVTITTSSACTAGTSFPYAYRDVALVLGDGSHLALGQDLESACVPSVTRFYRDNYPIEQPVRWETLSAELTLPEAVSAGRPLEFVVTLHNTGDRDIDLAPCGGYRISLTGVDMNGNELWKGVHATYRLSCDADPMLPAGSTRAYQMRLDVPADAPALDEAYVQWQLVDTSPDQSGQGYVAIHGS